MFSYATTITICLLITLNFNLKAQDNMSNKKFQCGDISDQAIMAMYNGENTFTFGAQSMSKFFHLSFENITLNNTQYIQKKTQEVAKVGDSFRIEFNKKDCIFETNNDQLEWRCYKRSPGVLGKDPGLDYHNASFFLYSRSVQSPYSTRKEFVVGVALKTGDIGETIIQQIFYQEKGKKNQGCRFNKKL